MTPAAGSIPPRGTAEPARRPGMVKRMTDEERRAKKYAQRRAYYAADPERFRAKSRAWGAANRERVRVRAQTWREANPERLKATAEAYSKAHPHRRQPRPGDKITRLRRIHGMTPEIWASIWDSQDGLCYLCGEPLEQAKHACVDHDHSCCGPQLSCRWCRRGLACRSCNCLIGLAGDDPEKLRR